MTIQKSTILFAAPEDSKSEIAAKKYIKDMILSSKDVKLYRSNGQILIAAIRDLD